MVDNALSFIANPGANPQPATWNDLLAPEYKGKLQYSTPGQAGDGTAVLVLLQHLMGKPAALDYLGKLQANNVGPSSSTGKLQPKVSNGELLVANGDVQMNLGSIKDDGSKFTVFFPAAADGKKTTVSLPYVAGVTKGAPHADAAKKLLAFLVSEDVQKTVAPDALGIPVLSSLVSSSQGGGRTEHPGRGAQGRRRVGAGLERRARGPRRRRRRVPEGHRQLMMADTRATRAAQTATADDRAPAPRTRRRQSSFDRVGVAYGRGKKATGGAGRLQPARRRGRDGGPAGSQRVRQVDRPQRAGRLRPAHHRRGPARRPRRHRPLAGHGAASGWCCSPTPCSRTCGWPTTSRSA